MGLFSKLLITALAAFGLGAIVFFLAGWFGALDNRSSRIRTINDLLEDKLEKFKIADDIGQINRENIRNHLQEFTKIPHLAGLERDEELARFKVKMKQKTVYFKGCSFVQIRETGLGRIGS